MKRTLATTTLIVLFIFSSLLVNCSEPLENTDGTVFGPVLPSDNNNDGEKLIICDRLNSGHKEFKWLLRNDEGKHRLEFIATSNNNKPLKTLIVSINEETHEWSPTELPELILEQTLIQNTEISIVPQNPNSFGNSVDICLWIEVF